MVLQRIFTILASALNLYSTLCFIRIILSWFPQVLNTAPGRVLCSIVDPYMNLFRKLPLQIGMIDFSPIVSMGILTLVASIIQNIAVTGILSVSKILIKFTALLWLIISTLGTIFFVFILIRLIVLLINRGTTPYNSFWATVDYSIQPRIFKIARFFTRGKPCSYTTGLTLTLVSIFVFVLLCFGVYIGLFYLFSLIPF